MADYIATLKQKMISDAQCKKVSKQVMDDFINRLKELPQEQSLSGKEAFELFVEQHPLTDHQWMVLLSLAITAPEMYQPLDRGQAQ